MVFDNFDEYLQYHFPKYWEELHAPQTMEEIAKALADIYMKELQKSIDEWRKKHG